MAGELICCVRLEWGACQTINCSPTLVNICFCFGKEFDVGRICSAFKLRKKSAKPLPRINRPAGDPDRQCQDAKHSGSKSSLTERPSLPCFQHRHFPGDICKHRRLHHDHPQPHLIPRSHQTSPPPTNSPLPPKPQIPNSPCPPSSASEDRRPPQPRRSPP